MKIFYRPLFAALAIAVLAAAPQAPAADAAAPVRLLGAEVAVSGTRTLISLTVDRAADARTLMLSGPDRFVVDVPASVLVGSIAARPAGVVRGIRHARQPDGAMRVVFDLSSAARLGARRIEAPADRTTKLVYELVGPAAVPRMIERKPEAAAVPVVFTPAAPMARMAPPRVEARAEQGRVVVIDAGHGGKDPGARGVAGTREKDVTLASALALRTALQERGYRVVLTRADDTFLELEDRVAIARREKAALFISLHADSHSDGRAHGASVYTLSERGETRARSMMGAQDWVVDIGEAPRDARVQNILVDLAQRETTGKSADFAQTLIAGLGSETPLLRNTHRSAGFFVLLAPDVPAALLEMGFLTHAGDEQRLASPTQRRRMMAAVADSIDVYFARPHAYAGR